MLAKEFLELLHRQPFRALKLRLSNGTAYEIRHPEIAAVHFSVVWLYLPKEVAHPQGNRVVVVSLAQIVEVELLPPVTSAKTNGAVT